MKNIKFTLAFISTTIFMLCYTIANSQAIRRAGLVQKDKEVQDGYILMTPMNYTKSYLFNKCGLLVKEWTCNNRVATTAHLDSEGNLWRAAQINSTFFIGGGKTGSIEKFSWDGKLIWKFEYANEQACLHHDFKVLKNGNLLCVAWERIRDVEAIKKGKNKSDLTDSLWSDKIMEVKPIGTNDYEIVWEWRAWDHLIQNVDSKAENYGVIAENPQLIDVNFVGKNVSKNDWLHTNSVDYNEELDQIIVSVLNFDEVWIIDHSTTKEEAKGHTGGKAGKGGDLLYRWGNPNSYSSKTDTVKKFFGMHDARWVKKGEDFYFSIFNNGQRRPEGNYSTVELIKLPLQNKTKYLTENSVFLPKEPEWIYKDPVAPIRFYASNISGAIQISDSNFIVTYGPFGQILEITKSGKTIWKYNNPVGANGPVEQGRIVPGQSLFKVSYYPTDFIGFSGKNMKATEPIELNPDYAICGSKSVSDEVTDEKLVEINVESHNIEIKTISNNLSRIKIYDLLGAEYLDKILIESSEIIKINNLSRGGYIAEFYDKKGKKFIKKIYIK